VDEQSATREVEDDLVGATDVAPLAIDDRLSSFEREAIAEHRELCEGASLGEGEALEEPRDREIERGVGVDEGGPGGRGELGRQGRRELFEGALRDEPGAEVKGHRQAPEARDEARDVLRLALEGEHLAVVTDSPHHEERRRRMIHELTKAPDPRDG